MLNTEEYKLLIESYLTGDLSTEQTGQLEKEISENPILQNEVSLQKSILSAIQSNRKAELKARLNNIDVSAGSGLKAWHYASIIGILTIIGVTGYYLLPFEEKQESIVVSTLSPKSTEEDNISSKDDMKPIASESTVSDLPSSQKKMEPSIEKQNAVVTTSSQIKTREVVPNLPDPNTPEGATHEPLDKEIENPQHGLGKTSHFGTSVPGVEVVKSKKHPFHYRYFDNKLFLYGNFETKTYDIIELNTSKGQEFYLKFDSNYYDLEPNKTEISKLELVKDEHTLSQLEKVQKK